MRIMFYTSYILNDSDNIYPIVAGAAPYGVFPNQPQLYATQGPPPPTYDQTLTHPMVRVIIQFY